MKQQKFKKALRSREKIFGAWVSYAEPSITETFAKAGFDFLAIDMEHSTITLPEAKSIITVSQYHDVACLPRPVSHSNDYIKPLLEFGADGMLIQMVNNPEDVKKLIGNIKYPPIGNRSYGVNRAQGYGFDFDSYINRWNNDSIFMIQIESIEGVKNIESILSYDEIDGVMIGPYDISGSLGVPGQLDHPDVIDASKKVIEACKKFNKSCGTQLNDPNLNNINSLFELGYTFAILGSDLFILWKWAEAMKNIIKDSKKT